MLKALWTCVSALFRIDLNKDEQNKQFINQKELINFNIYVKREKYIDTCNISVYHVARGEKIKVC